MYLDFYKNEVLRVTEELQTIEDKAHIIFLLVYEMEIISKWMQQRLSQNFIIY